MSGSDLVEREIESLLKELEVLSLIITKKKLSPLDAIEIRGAALSLAAIYNGMERILIQVLSDRQQNVKESSAWHTELLQKARSLGIISEGTMRDLKGFLGFRHFVRHAYSFEINPRTIAAVIDSAPELVERFITEIQSAD